MEIQYLIFKYFHGLFEAIILKYKDKSTEAKYIKDYM